MTNQLTALELAKRAAAAMNTQDDTIRRRAAQASPYAVHIIKPCTPVCGCSDPVLCPAANANAAKPVCDSLDYPYYLERLAKARQTAQQLASPTTPLSTSPVSQTQPLLPTPGDVEAALYGHRWPTKGHFVFGCDAQGWHLTPQAAQSLAVAVHEVLLHSADYVPLSEVPENTGT